MSQIQSSATLGEEKPTRDPDWNLLPPIYLLKSHFPMDELLVWEEKIPKAKLTYDPKDAKLFVGRVEHKKRAAFDLRELKLYTEDIDIAEQPSPKRRKVPAQLQGPNHGEADISIISSDSEDDGSKSYPSPISVRRSRVAAERGMPLSLPDLEGKILVINLGWLKDSLQAGHFVALEPYKVYYARRISSPKEVFKSVDKEKPHLSQVSRAGPPTPRKRDFGERDSSPNTIIDRAKADASSASRSGYVPAPSARRDFSNRRSHPPTQPPKLQPETTSEHDAEWQGNLPDPPQWVKDHLIYACQRSTPPNSPNEAFISLLDKIKKSRILKQDDIGVRAYSTSIASLRAYPYLLTSSREVLQLPGCDKKIVLLFNEFKSTGTLQVVKDIEANEELQVLDLFWNIWNVGPKTAQSFYDRGWRDLEDIYTDIDCWKALNRGEQAGIKFYDEFMLGIPRAEVEAIASVIHDHAKQVRDDEVECIIVGGYRRGKTESGDVDLILSHQNEQMTLNLATDVTDALGQSGYVTHKLTLHETNTHREQQTLPLRAAGGGHGFDTLDKSFVVWQDPNFEDDNYSIASSDSEAAAQKKKRNPNPHRRVDIIISPWRTVGCAILGWSGATTFQRDIRRFVRKEKGWKFDSSGVRDRASGGRVLDLESPRDGDGSDTWQDRERRLMEGLGIGYRPPEERCTG